jgi:hypothetical protein
MQKSAEIWSDRPHPGTDQVLTISNNVYHALHPLDRLIAQSLLKIGKVRIVDEDDETVFR